jgi:hypothetical protein
VRHRCTKTDSRTKEGFMRHKFLGIGEPGYHPLRKLRTVFSGLR